MASGTRSQTAMERVKFPVVCHAEIRPEILNGLLEEDVLALVAQSDLSEVLTSNDGSIDGDRITFKTPFTGTLPDDVEPMWKFMAAAKEKAGISSKVFVILDSQTAQDGETCQVSSYDDDSDEDDYKDPLPFRCALSSVVAALRAMEESPEGRERSTARVLRNEAAVAGGVWSQASAARQHAKTPRFDPAEYPRSEAWDTASEPKASEDPLPYISVFRTADISLDTLNALCREAYDERPEADPSIAQPQFAFVTSLDRPFHSGPVNLPLESVPALPSLLDGASPSECDHIVRHLFAPQGTSELNYNYFVIVDELTEGTKTVLLANNREGDGALQLLRSDFRSALNALLAPMSTILTQETMASEAAVQSLGVNRT
ncbi:unnamed protein product [Discula destructiva]